MGLSAANEMLILGKKVGSTRAVEVGLCSEVVVEDGGVGGDPFLEGSIGGKMCREVEERLLSLPHGDATAKVRIVASYVAFVCLYSMPVWYVFLCNCCRTLIFLLVHYLSNHPSIPPSHPKTIPYCTN